ncbi:hypothetical protein DES53_10580 [Roseimicrobium gellanilyticum]|uniref:Uncharacterized protein n=1 Tax=Roseimicrobium gellanilyticum TaxID=748857 RepID=A0A366HN84_9BACT|nr:DUF6065 family protein [Roseimicrobium gellanilyticum]RBP43681.1 hypothetical protein DES53_10580 [Roseimicrobium gellanilyticum]
MSIENQDTLRPRITAYEVGAEMAGWTITPASYQRQLMDDTPGRGAYRCLPLSMANQAGWFVHCAFGFTAVWNGEVDSSGITLDFPEETREKASASILSHFGCGIITFRLPFLFRTPPGVGLLVRGAPNWPLVNFHPLEGLVETDWSSSTFTMNWKILEPGREVRFDPATPVCFIQPFDMDLPEKLEAHRMPVKNDPEIEKRFCEWRKSRSEFMNSEVQKRGGWQKDYFQGVDTQGNETEVHRTNFRLSKFPD